MHQTRCRLYGDIAADYVWRRDVQHESFPQVFDRLVMAMDDETMSPETKARLGASMRLALAVYAHPTWTAADAYAMACRNVSAPPRNHGGHRAPTAREARGTASLPGLMLGSP